jgi:hypothetical protein
MTARSFSNLLAPLGWLVLIGGWVIAVVAFLVIGTESCATVQVTLANVQVCQDTTSQAVILLAVIGFAATVGSLFLFALRYLLAVLDDIESNTRAGGR